MAAATATVSPIDPSLVFWAANMGRINDAGMSWPGFSYTDEEWERLGKLGGVVGGGAYIKFQFWTALVFIIFAIAAIIAMFGLMIWLYPDTSKTPASVFIGVLACVCFLTIGFGVPAAMAAASRLSASGVNLATVEPNPMDAGLAAKVRFQLWRMTAIMCGVFVPGALLWIAYDISAGPIVTALKLAAIGLMGFSILFARRK